MNFNEPQGKQDFAAEINELFARFGLAFRLEPNGKVIRLTAPALENIIGVGFSTGDAKLNELLEDAVKEVGSSAESMGDDRLR